MIKLLLIFILCVCVYTLGEESGKKEITKLIKQYWEESSNVNDFWRRYTILWNEYVGEETNETTRSR